MSKEEFKARLKRFFLSPVSTGNDKELKTRLTRLVLLRVVILSILLGASIWSTFTEGFKAEFSNTSFMLIACTYVISLFNLILLQYKKCLRPLLYIQLATDVVLATFAIKVTGSIACVGLYLVLTIGSALLFNRFGAIYTATLSGLSYAVLAGGLLDPVSTTLDMQITSLDVLSMYLSLVCIALLGSYFSDRLNLISEIADKRGKDLSQHQKRHKQMLNDISDGIITLDLNSCITGINQTARAIIGLTQYTAEDCVGKKAKTVFRKYGLAELEELVKYKSYENQTLEMQFENDLSGRNYQLECQLKSFEDTDGTNHAKAISVICAISIFK